MSQLQGCTSTSDMSPVKFSAFSDVLSSDSIIGDSLSMKGSEWNAISWGRRTVPRERLMPCDVGRGSGEGEGGMVEWGWHWWSRRGDTVADVCGVPSMVTEMEVAFEVGIQRFDEATYYLISRWQESLVRMSLMACPIGHTNDTHSNWLTLIRVRRLEKLPWLVSMNKCMLNFHDETLRIIDSFHRCRNRKRWSRS
jgi:hypothetical protein